MPRSYRHIKEYEKEIYELLTNREIAEKLGFESEQVKGLIKRHKDKTERQTESKIGDGHFVYGQIVYCLPYTKIIYPPSLPGSS